MSDRIRLGALFLGPVVAVLFGWLVWVNGLSIEAAIACGVTVICVVWWIFEPIPIPVTSMLPLAVLPLTGVLTAEQVATAYGDKLILLLLGGFILSTAMERSGAHRRLALGMVRLFGGSSTKMLVLGFMVAAAILSMWISNTATTLMLLPVAIAVMEKSKDPNLTIPLLLGTAHAASLGGIGTPIGTPPNVIFRGVYEQMTGYEVGFLEWMTWGVPVVIIFLPLMWLWLTRHATYRGATDLPEVGHWTPAERRVLLVFGMTALAWVTRKEPFGGWSTWFGLPGAHDGVVALLAVVALFLIPDGKGERLLNWETANKIPWGMLILFGAGISIAKAFTESGLSVALANQLGGLELLHPLLIMMIICFAVTFLTETTSNTATTTLLMPILAAAAIGAAIDPRLLMVPAAMSASCAFMLPVATPPNVVVFATGRFPLRTMVREGVVLNLIGLVVISLVCFVLIG